MKQLTISDIDFVWQLVATAELQRSLLWLEK